jgi:hypothetical protein
LRVPESLLGQTVKCPSCSHTFAAPDNVEEEAPRRRPAAPPPDDEYDDEPRPSKRRPRADDYDDYDEDYEEIPRRRGREKPGKVQAIAIMILIGGILATLSSVCWLAYIGIIGAATLGFGLLCCLWPGPYFGLTLGIMAILKGSRLLGDKAHREKPPQGIGVMMIINIINGDLANLAMGIIVLVFLSDPEVKGYFRG